MAGLAEYATDTFFIVAVSFPLIIVVTYCATKVRARLEELKGALLANNLEPTRWAALGRAATDHPAWLLAGRSLRKPTTPETAIELKFASIHGFRHWVIPTLLTLLLSAAGLWLCRVWVHARWFPASTVPTGKHFPQTMNDAVIMALAGAYVWGIWELLNRRRTGDLTPSELYDVAFRWAVAVPIGHAFSLLAGEQFQPAFAFAASAFPLKDIKRLVQERAMKKLVESSATQGGRPEERHLGTAVDGLSDATLTRLEELGIVTALDMAYADATRVMIKTGYPLLNVLDWMDQAMLCVYAGDKRKAFLDAGLRCSIDVCEFVDLHLSSPGLTPRGLSALRALHKKIESSPSVGAMPSKPSKSETEETEGEILLVDLLRRIVADPQVKLLYDLWYTAGAPQQLGGGVREAA